MKKKIIIIACICAYFTSLFCSCNNPDTDIINNPADTVATNASTQETEASEFPPDSPVDDAFIENFNIQNIKMAFENIFLKVEIENKEDHSIFITAENDYEPYMKSIICLDSNKNIKVIELICTTNNSQPAQANTMALVSLLQSTTVALSDSGIDISESIENAVSDIPESAFKTYIESNTKEEYYWEDGCTSLVYTIPDPNDDTKGMFTYTVSCNTDITSEKNTEPDSDTLNMYKNRISEITGKSFDNLSLMYDWTEEIDGTSCYILAFRADGEDVSSVVERYAVPAEQSNNTIYQYNIVEDNYTKLN